MPKRVNVVYVDYEEAQKLIPIFAYYAKEGSWKEVRTDARVLLDELRDVRDVDYSPLSGRQMFLTEEQYGFLDDVRAGIG